MAHVKVIMRMLHDGSIVLLYLCRLWLCVRMLSPSTARLLFTFRDNTIAQKGTFLRQFCPRIASNTGLNGRSMNRTFHRAAKQSKVVGDGHERWVDAFLKLQQTRSHGLLTTGYL